MIKGVINNKNIQNALSKFSQTFCYLRVKPNLTEIFLIPFMSTYWRKIICTNIHLGSIQRKKKSWHKTGLLLYGHLG